MPTGPAIRYAKVREEVPQEDPRFVRSMTFNYESKIAMQFLTDPMNNLEGFKHAFNCGHEVFVGPYRVDAISDEHREIVEVHGCWAHALDCMDRYVEGEQQQAKKRRHEERIAFIKAMLPRYTLREYWTCDERFNKYRYNNKKVGSPCRDNWKLGKLHPIRRSELLRCIEDGSFFGFAEVDIRVPAHLRDLFKHFPPLFATIEVPYDVIGE